VVLNHEPQICIEEVPHVSRRLTRAGAFCVGFGVCALAVQAQQQQAATAAPEVQPAPDQWIAPIPDGVDVPLWGWMKYRRAQWVVWPSAEYIAARQPPRDRRRQFPSVYPRGDRRLPPLRQGASSMRGVKYTCVSWLKHFLRPEYIAEDPEASLVLLQEPDPRQSWVASRFEANGTAIQVVERVWAICYVIRPAPALIEGLEPKEIGPAVFRAVFKGGEGMASRPVTEVAGLPDGLHAFVGGDAADYPGWFWYTDGETVAVHVARYDGGAHMPTPKDIWF